MRSIRHDEQGNVVRANVDYFNWFRYLVGQIFFSEFESIYPQKQYHIKKTKGYTWENGTW